MIVLIHTVFCVIALVAGGVIFLNPKGTPIHKRIGMLYNISMIILIATSFGIIELFDGFGVYHVTSIISLVTLLIGMYFPLFGRHIGRWYIQHYIWMSYSYVGLLMAGGSHLFQVFPDWSAGLRMVLFWGVPYVLGTILIFTNTKKIANDIEKRFPSFIQKEGS